MAPRLRTIPLAVAALLVLGAPVRAGILDAFWIEPTTNVDGSPLTDLAAYRVYYALADDGCSAATFEDVAAANAGPAALSTVTHRLTGLATGSPYFVAVTAVDASGNESACVKAPRSTLARIDFSAKPTATTSFGEVPINGFAQRTFTVKNTGGGAVTGTAATAAPFRVVSGGTFTLAGAGATQAVVVRFSPTITADATASVTFTANGATLSRIVTGAGVPADLTRPTIAMLAPTTAATYQTTQSSLTLAGTAADDVAVTRVTWKSSTGATGLATGTSAWAVTAISLQMGTNVLTITARDAAFNTASARFTVTRVEAAAAAR